MKVLHIVGGTARAGGVMTVATDLAAAQGPQHLVWKHKDFYSNDPRIKFVSKGWAQKTDTGIAGDLMAACVELIPLYRFVKHNRGMILHAHTRMGIIAGSIVGWLTGTAPVVVHHHALAGRPWLYRQWWRFFGSKVRRTRSESATC